MNEIACIGCQPSLVRRRLDYDAEPNGFSDVFAQVRLVQLLQLPNIGMAL